MPSAAADRGAEYEAKAASFVKENRLPGAAVGIVHEGKLVWTKGIGFADVKKKRRADPKTLYRIASITKTFTATAVMQLRDEGKLALDDPLMTYLPELASARSGFGPIEGLTIRRLLSHESGLQSEPPGTGTSRGVLYESEAAKNLAQGRGHLADGAAERAVEVLEPRLPAARGARSARVGDDVREVHPLEDPHPAEDDVDGTRPSPAAAPSA